MGPPAGAMYAFKINLVDLIYLNNRIRLAIFVANKYFNLNKMTHRAQNGVTVQNGEQPIRLPKGLCIPEYR